MLNPQNETCHLSKQRNHSCFCHNTTCVHRNISRSTRLVCYCYNMLPAGQSSNIVLISQLPVTIIKRVRFNQPCTTQRIDSTVPPSPLPCSTEALISTMAHRYVYDNKTNVWKNSIDEDKFFGNLSCHCYLFCWGTCTAGLAGLAATRLRSRFAE